MESKIGDRHPVRNKMKLTKLNNVKISMKLYFIMIAFFYLFIFAALHNHYGQLTFITRGFGLYRKKCEHGTPLGLVMQSLRWKKNTDNHQSAIIY